MEAETICEVVRNLVGNIYPSGCSTRDKESNRNLTELVKVLEMLSNDINNVKMLNEGCYEHSVKEGYEIASKYIDLFKD